MKLNEKLFTTGDEVIVLSGSMMGSTGVVLSFANRQGFNTVYVHITRTSYLAQENIDFHHEMYPENIVDLSQVEFGIDELERISGYAVSERATMLSRIGTRIADAQKSGADVNMDLYAFILDHTNSLEDFCLANNLSPGSVRNWILRGRPIPVESQIILAEVGYPMDARGMSTFAHDYVQRRIDEGEAILWRSVQRSFNENRDTFERESAYFGWQIEVYGVYQSPDRNYPQVAWAITYRRSWTGGDYFTTKMRLSKLSTKATLKLDGSTVIQTSEFRFKIPGLTPGEQYDLAGVLKDEYPEHLERAAI